MLLEPGVIRRALHGKIERDFHLQQPAGCDEFAKILQRAQFRMHRIVAAFGAADRVGASRIAFRRRHGVVAALAVGMADRVDRGQIHHVKSHRGNVGQAFDAILEGTMLARRLALAARYHLVPRAISRARSVRHQWKQGRPRQVVPQLALGHRVLQFVGQ